MPRIIYTPRAIADLVRLAKFLSSKDKTVAKRAISAIRTAIEKAAIFPDRYRPVPDLIHYREIIIDFGDSGYIVRFRYETGEDIFIVRIKHQLENDPLT
jgi:plasmid stabilization system protein ParE